MRLLNLRFILFSLLSFFLIFSAVAEYSKNSNDKDLGPGNVNTQLTAEPKALEVREHCIRYNGGIDPDCQYSLFQIEKEKEPKLYLDNSEKELATKQLQEIIDLAQSNFEAFDMLLSQIKGNKQCFNEPFGATLAKLEESKNILSTIMNRVLVCDSKVVLNPKTYSKPDFEHIFLNEIHSERGLELYYELTNGPFANRQHRDMVTLLDKTVKSIAQIPALCDAKWNAERNIETAVDYTFGYKPTLSDSIDLPRIKYGRDDNGYGNDETEENRDDTGDAEPVLVKIPTKNA